MCVGTARDGTGIYVSQWIICLTQQPTPTQQPTKMEQLLAQMQAEANEEKGRREALEEKLAQQITESQQRATTLDAVIDGLSAQVSSIKKSLEQVQTGQLTTHQELSSLAKAIAGLNNFFITNNPTYAQHCKGEAASVPLPNDNNNNGEHDDDDV